MNAALMLIDIQQDYFPGGRMEVAGSVEASKAARILLEYFRANKLPVIHIQHIATRKGATFFLPDTKGIEFHDHVLPLSGELIIKKHYPNSFRDTDLSEYLKSNAIDELFICGMMSHMCIDATVRAAFDYGYSCMVVHDACATRDLVFQNKIVTADHVHSAFMAALGAVYSKILNVDEAIEQLKNT